MAKGSPPTLDAERMAALEPKAALELALKHISGISKGFNSKLLGDEIRVLSGRRPSGSGASATAAAAEYEFTVTRHWTSGMGTMHGAAQTLVLDDLTTITLALISRPGYWQFLGASRVLSTTYLLPPVVGDVLVIKCEVVNIGKRLCALRGEIRRKRDGALVATCENNKVNIDPPVPSGSKL